MKLASVYFGGAEGDEDLLQNTNPALFQLRILEAPTPTVLQHLAVRRM